MKDLSFKKLSNEYDKVSVKDECNFDNMTDSEKMKLLGFISSRIGISDKFDIIEDKWRSLRKQTFSGALINTDRSIGYVEAVLILFIQLYDVKVG